MRTTTTVFLAILCAFVVLAYSGHAAAEDAQLDKVLLKNGQTQSGKVSSAKFDKVTLGGRAFNSSEVARIVWFDTPPDFVEANEMLERGEYDNALFKFKLALDVPGVRDWIKVEVEVARAEIAWLQSKWEEAKTIYEGINKSYPDNFFLRLTAWRPAVCLIKQGKYPEAETAFDAITKDAKFANEDLKWRAGFWKVYTVEARDNYLDAYQQYLKLSQEAFRAIPTDVKTLMVSNKAIPAASKPIVDVYIETSYRGNLCMAMAGKVPDARKEFADMAKKTDLAIKNVGVIGGAICDVIELSAKDSLDAAGLDQLDVVRHKLAESLIFNADSDERRADLFYWAGRACLLIQRWDEARAYFDMVVKQYPDALIAKAARTEFDKIAAVND